MTRSLWPVRLAVGLAAAALLLAGCVPWRAYPVSPRIDGRLAGVRSDARGVELEIRNESTPGLAVHATSELDEDGRFHFDEQSLVLGGREFFKRYIVLLRLERGDGSHEIVWRGEWFREPFGKRLLLDCELDRPDDFGQVCRVPGATEQPWLVTNGQIEFQRVCGDCHGVNADGHGVKSTELAGVPPDLRRISARRGGAFDYDEIYSWIDGRRRTAAHGLGEMPVWGLQLGETTSPDSHHLTTARIDAIVAYLESIQQPAETR